MNPIKKKVHFTIEADGDMQTAITQELMLEWVENHYECHNYFDIESHTWRGFGPSQTAAILDWLASRLGVK